MNVGSGFNWQGVLLGQAMSLLMTVAGAAHQMQSNTSVDLSGTLMFLVYAPLAFAFWAYRVARRFWLRSETSVSSSASLVPSPVLVQVCVALSLLDAGASVLALHANQHISMLAVQLLLTLATPTAMVVSWIASRARYSPRHVVGALFAVAGTMGFCAWQIYRSLSESTSEAVVRRNPLLGYGMVVAAAVLYGTSNVLMEALMQGALADDAGVVGVLATNSTFSALWSALYVVCLRWKKETDALRRADALYAAGYVLPMLLFYIGLPMFLARHSAALLTLSLLTVNILSLPISMWMCNERVGDPGLLLPFAAVVAGIAVYNSPPFWRRSRAPIKASAV